MAAVREIATRVFGASRPAGESNTPRAGKARHETLMTADAAVLQLIVAKGTRGEEGDLHLSRTAAIELKTTLLADPDERPAHIAVVMDGDVVPPAEFKDQFERYCAQEAPEWQLGPTGERTWQASSGGTTIEIALIQWRSPRATGKDNLDHLICAVAERSFGEADAELVRAILNQMETHVGKPSTCKTEKHLWCALREPKADEESAPVRFLGQARQTRDHVEPVLKNVSLFADLAPVLSGP